MLAAAPIVGVVLAALSSFVIGGIWYSPGVFLKSWMEMTGTKDSDMKKRFPAAMAAMGVAALLTAWVLALAILYVKSVSGVSGIATGLEVSFILWLGISATTTVVTGVLEPRKISLMAMQAGNRLVSLLVMGLILGAFL